MSFDQVVDIPGGAGELGKLLSEHFEIPDIHHVLEVFFAQAGGVPALGGIDISVWRDHDANRLKGLKLVAINTGRTKVEQDAATEGILDAFHDLEMEFRENTSLVDVQIRFLWLSRRRFTAWASNYLEFKQRGPDYRHHSTFADLELFRLARVIR